MKYKKYFLSLAISLILVLLPNISYADNSRNLFSDFISTFFSINNKNQTSAVSDTKTLAPIRILKLNTLGKDLFLTASDTKDYDGILTEVSSSGSKLKEWKVKYEQKGHARGVCEPPMLNISFDKTTSKGKAKELFTGLSTYAGYTQLQYQKIRLIPECDTWNDYFLTTDTTGSIGLSGKLNVLLREYVIHKIFRAYGVPTADIIGFTNITFDSSDPKYKGKVFRYMIVQRPQEKDDQIPFTTQFNFKPDLYESGNTVLWRVSKENSYGALNDQALLANNNTGEQRKIIFDKESALRFLLLTNFTELGDTGFLHNEDGGIDIKTGEVKSIPHGFDESFGCIERDLHSKPTHIEENFDQLPGDSRQEYRNIYYRIAKEIFGNKEGLDKVLNIVNSFPYEDIDKSLIISYLKVKFYEYSEYFNSEVFARNMSHEYNPKDKYLPYTESEYVKQKKNLIESCSFDKTDLKGVTISVIEKPTITITEEELDENQSKDYGVTINKSRKVAYINGVIEIKTSNSELKVFKQGVFESSLYNTKDDVNAYDNYLILTYNVSGVDDSIGPYHIIPPNTKARLNMHAFFYDDSTLKGSYYFKLSKFNANNQYNTILLNLKSNTIDFGSLSPIKVSTPKSGEILNVNSKYDISWSGSANRMVVIEIIDNKTGMSYPVSKDYSDLYSNNRYTWNVGQIYRYDYKTDSFKSKILDSGNYRIQVWDTAVQKIIDSVDNITIINSKKPRIIGMTSPKSGDIYEKGDAIEIVWNTSNILANDDIKIDLMGHNNTKLILNIDKIKNDTDRYIWKIPNNLDLDTEDLYVIRVTDITGKELATKSGRFNITERSEPTVEVLNNKMKLRYDANNKESALQVDTRVVITAPKDRDIFIPSQYAFNLYAIDDNNNGIYGLSIYSTDLPLKADGYTIIAGTSANFDIVSNLEALNKAFPGVYKAHLSGLVYGKDFNKYKKVQDSFSNPVAIIGETSPYIEETEYNQSESKIILTGVRYGNGVMDLTVGDYKDVYTKKVTPIKSGDKDVVIFSPKDFNFPVGQDFINIQLTHSVEGQSNVIYLRIK